MQKIDNIIKQTVTGLGYELVNIEHTPARLIRVFIDKANGGVNIDDCERVSNQLNNVFFVENIEYNRLEVSSPGIERPLNSLADFKRFKGQLAKIKTLTLIDNTKVFEGVIHDVVDENIMLELTQSRAIITINYAFIRRARLVFDYKRDKPVKNK